MMKSQIRFEMADWQTDLLEELFNAAERAYENNAPGMIIGQVKRLNSGDSRGYFAFVDSETAKRIRDALRDERKRTEAE